MWSSIIAWPAGDCCAAKRKVLLGSRRITNLTQPLQRLQTPSNRIIAACSAIATRLPPNEKLLHSANLVLGDDPVAPAPRRTRRGNRRERDLSRSAPDRRRWID